jgi:aminopeptidase N
LNLSKDDLGIQISNFYREWFVDKLTKKQTPSVGGTYTKDLVNMAKSIAKTLVGKPVDIIGRLIAGTSLNFETILNGVYGGNKEIQPLKTAAEFYAKQEVKNIQILNHFSKQMENVLSKKKGYQEVINAMKEQGFKMQLPMELTIKVGNFNRFQKALGYNPQIANLYKLIIEIINENFNDLL